MITEPLKIAWFSVKIEANTVARSQVDFTGLPTGFVSFENRHCSSFAILVCPIGP
jgi:hypothetical protein